MDDLNHLQLKANDGKAYKFATAKISNTKDTEINFKTQQLATLHLQKFAYLQPKRGADLLAVLGMLDFPAEIRARSIGPTALSSAYRSLAKAIFEGTLCVYEVPAVEPVLVHQPTIFEKISNVSKKIGTKGGKDEHLPTGKSSIKNTPKTVSPDEMAFCGDPVSMSTGEEILSLTDISLAGNVSFTWQRQYRSSLCNQNIGLGYGWRSNFHFELTKELLEDGNQWRFIDQQGDTLQFDDIGVGAVSYQLSAGASLSHDSRGYYLLTLNDGRQIRFVYQHQRWVADRIRASELEIYHLTYSEAGRLIRISARGNRQLECRYDAGGNLIEVLGKGAAAQASLSLSSYEYDVTGDLTRATNRQQHIEHYWYDGHLLRQRQRASGFSHYFEWSGSGPQARCLAQWGDGGHYCYRFEYDEINYTSVSTDSLGNTWRYEHNAQGLLTRKVSPKGNIWRFSYDSLSRKVAEIMPDGAVTHYRYNENGQLSELETADKSVTTFRYNRLGQIIQTTDGESRVWRSNYNSFGRLLSQIGPDGAKREYEYDRHGMLVRIKDANDRHQCFWWNDQGRLTAFQDGEAVTRYSYDGLGEINGTINADGWVTQYSRNSQGAVSGIVQYHETQPNESKVQQIEYDNAGRVVSVTDTLGRNTNVHYEGLSQPVRLDRPDGSWLVFQYDQERNLTSIERSDGNTYQLEYDGEERVSKTVGFDGRTQQYHYDGQGQLVRLSEQGGRYVRLRRDLCGRVIEQQSGNKSTSPQTNHFCYDKLGRIRYANNAERKVTVSYHANGQPLEVWQDNWQLQHQYNAVGQRVGTRLPDGQQIRYRYNEHGLLSAIDWNRQPLIECQFDSSGRETSRQQSNSIIHHQQFDMQGRLSEQSWQQAQQRHQRYYQYNEGNQLVGIDDSEQGLSEFHFDPLDQLRAFLQPKQQETYSLDGFGNTEGEESNVQGDRLLSQKGIQYTYDAFGNQTRLQSPTDYQQRQYSGLNQLTSVKSSGRLTQYQYDALGRRSAKITERGRTDYLWDGEQLIGEYSSGEFTWYIYAPGTFKPIALSKQGQIYHYHLDHLGTPLKLTDSRGTVAWLASYQVNGRAEIEIESVVNPLRFQGQYYDEESGLHYNRFRYYDPQTGRFIHQDPIGLLGGINHYQYAPNPLQWIDPLGLSCKEEKSVLNESSFPVTPLGSIESIQGWASKGFLKTMISDATFGIVYGDTSGLPFLRVDPIDRSDMEAYEAVSGLERYASIFTPAGAANFTKNAVSEGIWLAKNNKTAITEFSSKLKGKLITLSDVEVLDINYTRRSRESLDEIRKKFNSSDRKNFLKSIGRDPDKIKLMMEAGLNANQIEKIAQGGVPKGYNVHHKVPIDDGGTNKFDNLILIINNPEHYAITNAQRALTGHISYEETVKIEFPVPKSFIYPVNKQ
ncbi:RHS repeat-associated core domain-containing protein [Photobacterium lutimaris]|uniref:Type IV secretion protein Rhs n=1 Tax=Photobacterium lutimaris TaxID=388278 RepID=A0A2T3IZN0_9GAMM|nr:RHS repeat-associated core domain-containing protein [Photobacterium lutimaris]PSU34144.1 type IV secretion protein Rhs [Photobacterium lutimaris]TDR75716.1 RHS repeat-associated protein [Photobacterium lutimaris]